MFRKFGAVTSQAKRAVLEKAGKVEATKETEEFNCKIKSLSETKSAFTNLQRVGASIFRDKKQEGVTNPADDFMVEIKEVVLMDKNYKKARLAFDTAKDREHSATLAAQQPGKNQAKKELNAQSATTERETKETEYTEARTRLEQGISGLEDARDQHFEDAIKAMCDILSNLTPDWQMQDNSPVPSPGQSPGQSPGGGLSEEKKDDFSVPPPTSENQEPPSGEFAPPTNTEELTKPTTDSESD